MAVDLAFMSGRVHTVDHDGPSAEAVAVQAGRIVAVGRSTDVRHHVGPRTAIVDLGGRSLVPGFQDAHVHPCTAGVEMGRCDLLNLPADPAAYAAAVATYADANPDLPWIVGKGWAMDAFVGGIAHRSMLDAVVPDRPVYLVNRDGHGAWANTLAFDLADVDAATPDPPDGRIERDATGEPIGTLQEGAMALVGRHTPSPTDSDIDAGILRAEQYLLSLGITAWQDAWVEPAAHAAYVRLGRAERLRARVVGSLWWDRERSDEQIEELVARRAETPAGRYRATTVKMMLDGVCENFTAAMLSPYHDPTGEPTGGTGIDFIDPAQLGQFVTSLDALDFQVHFHALGDRAVRQALDAIEEARLVNGPRANRHHLAHLQVVDPLDRSRFAHLDATANAQPLWAHHDDAQDELTIPFLGPERSARQYPWRSLASAGARLAFGSDWDVSTPNPLEIIHVAVTRTHPEGRDEVFYPSERIPLHDALTAATLGSAYVNGIEQTTGSIEPGKMADLVVIDRPLDAGPLHEAAVDMTFIDGDVAYERRGAA